MKMNDHIREEVRKAIKALPMSQAEFARQLDLNPHVLSRALLHQGKTPEVWEKVFAALGYRLTIEKIEQDG
ncbi:hypothetical protein Dxin01_01322 [Deinococcus xinjiangensis]|uniref:HTH cro/C1-type domain-containing protein n=1 Tax=Deinococcus xinjiangensis TaxID=457454 RepID=A0ABP9V8K3_9DEIO